MAVNISIESFGWDTAGWTVQQRSPTQVHWTNAAGDVMVQRFGPSTSTGLPPGWRDAATLRAHFGTPTDPRLAMISIDVVAVAGSIPAAQYVHKERMPAPSLGMMIGGMVAVPFARFFTTVMYIAKEHGTTGLREATLLAAGKVPVPAPAAPPREVSGDEMFDLMRSVPPRRLPADDEEWDSLFPQHPLSRVRSYLRRLRETFEVDAAARAEPPYAG